MGLVAIKLHGCGHACLQVARGQVWMEQAEAWPGQAAVTDQTSPGRSSVGEDSSNTVVGQVDRAAGQAGRVA